VPKVHFVNELISVDVPEGTPLRQVAREQGIELYRGMWTHVNCFGNGLCGRCRLWVLSTTTRGPNWREWLHRSVRGEMRLACQLKILEDVEVRTRPLGGATVKPDRVPSYREQAEQRLREAREAEAAAARKAAEAKAAAEKPAVAEKPAPADTSADSAVAATVSDAGPAKSSA
jgi:ferredoxin